MASTLKVILAVGGIFVAGAVTGGLASLRVAEYRAREQREQARFGPNELGGRLAEQLRLTPEQKEQVRPIINRTSEALRKIRRDAFNQTAGLIAKMDEDLMKVLTPEQRVRLGEIRATEEERRKRWMQDRGKRQEPRPPGAPDGERPPPEPPPAR